MHGPRRTTPEIARLIEALKRLVAEQRRLERRGSSERLEANRREVDRLQEALADVVRRRLATAGATA